MLLAISLLSTLIGHGHGQETDWTDLAPTLAPSERHYHNIAYDAESDRVILFGGQRIGPDSDETWAYDFDTNTWSLMNPSTSPSPRLMHAMAYDAESDRVILFGGIFKENPETWAYDFNTDQWTNMTPAIQPAGYVVAGMAYDSESDRMVLFGGDTENVYIHSSFTDETWSYDHNVNTWTRMNPGLSPSARGGQGMAYDVDSDRVILFGGGAGLFGDLGDTWAYNFNSDTWSQMNPSEAPFPRHEPGMAYDARSDRVVLFGGSGGQDETWVYDFDENLWTRAEKGTGPPRRRVTNLAYDSESERIILFGGVRPITLDQFLGDTWAYTLSFPAAQPPFPWELVAVGVAIGVVGIVSVYWLLRRHRRGE